MSIQSLRNRLRAKEDQGMSMVEVSVALVILGIVLSALASFLLTAIKAQTGGEARTRATQLAQEAVEQVRALPWERAGFYPASMATATSNCPASGAQANQPLVQLAALTPADARVPTGALQTRVIDTVQFSVLTCVHWEDDPTDLLGAADLDGTQDVKKVVVTVAWVDKGKPKSSSVTGRRAPTASEVAPKTGSGNNTFRITAAAASPSSGSLNNSGKTTSAVQFLATTSGTVSLAQLTWTDNAGIPYMLNMSVGASSNQYVATLPTGSGPFNPTGTTFTIKVFGPAGDQASQNVTVSFANTSGSMQVANAATATPNSVDIGASGASQVAFTVSASANGTITSGTVSYTTRTGGTATVSMVVKTTAPNAGKEASVTFPIGSGSFPDGADLFTVNLTGASGSAASTTTVNFVPPNIVPVKIIDATIKPGVCVDVNNPNANSAYSVIRPSTVDVYVSGIAATDIVKLNFNDDTNHTSVTATYVSTTADALRFATTIDTSWRWKGQVTSATMAVTATRPDKTQATTTYGFPIERKNLVTECAP